MSDGITERLDIIFAMFFKCLESKFCDRCITIYERNGNRIHRDEMCKRCADRMDEMFPPIE